MNALWRMLSRKRTSADGDWASVKTDCENWFASSSTNSQVTSIDSVRPSIRRCVSTVPCCS